MRKTIASALILLAATAAIADSVSYEYDELGRLKKVTKNDGTVVDYGLDPAGNRTSQVVTLTGDNPINDSIPSLGVGPNLVDISTWPIGSAPMGVADIVPWLTGATFYNETRWARVMGPGFSGYVTTMETGQTETDNNGGGTNATNTFTIDPTKGYEYSIYVRKHDLTRQNVYLGAPNRTPASVKHAINNGETSNPYFLAWSTSTQQTNLDDSKWYKVVGYVLPEGYPTVASYNDWGGVYDVVSGTKVANVTPYRWNEHRTSDSMFARFFTYYDQAQQNIFTNYFYQPAVYATSISYTPGVPAVTLTNTNANEGDNITFTVNLSSATTVDTAVNYVVDHPGGANSASSNDYTAASGTLSFAAGTTQVVVTVPTIEDVTPEADELIRITLSTPVRLTLSNTTRQASIINDDVSNSPPNAGNDWVSFTWKFQTAWLYVLNNDSDPDNDPLTITSVTQPSNATVTIHTSPQRLKVVSTRLGSSDFTYTISDGNGGTDTASVTVEVGF